MSDIFPLTEAERERMASIIEMAGRNDETYEIAGEAVRDGAGQVAVRCLVRAIEEDGRCIADLARMVLRADDTIRGVAA